MLSGGGGADFIAGDHGEDSLVGGAGDDSLLGGDDDDTLNGGDGRDLLNGGASFDYADYGDSSDGVTINLALTGAQSSAGTLADGDTLTSVEGVIGTDQADHITGDAHANGLSGGAGNDTLEGGDGPDTLDGGGGDDFASYASATSAVSVNLWPGRQGGVGSDANGDRMTSIEGLIGSDFDDRLVSTGGATLSGGAGDDTLTADLLGNDLLDGGTGFDYAD